MIPYGRQAVSESDIETVVEVLRSDWLTQGPVVDLFEDSLRKISGAKHAVAVSNGTAALHVACLALRLGPGDVLWTVPNTFVATANCARYCGADVDFVDIDPATWNISLSALKNKLSQARKSGRLPKIVAPVHFAGQPTEQEEIWALAREYKFHVVEDAAHAIGAKRNGEPVGSCRWSDITIFSFHPVKIITTGEGGVALTNDEELAWRMQMLRSHGITREMGKLSKASPGSWYYEQQMLGFNYRLSDIHAALGLSQLKRLSRLVEQRNALAGRYSELLAPLPVQLPTVLPGNVSAFHLYVVRIRLQQLSKQYPEVFESIRRRGIGVNLHYIPVHLQPYYRCFGFEPGLYPEAERYSQEALTLPLYPTLLQAEQDRVVSVLADALA